MLTLRQEGLLCMALQELFWANAVHAIGMAKRGCWLNSLYTHFILSGVNFPLVLQSAAEVSNMSTKLKTSTIDIPGNDREAAWE